MNDKTIRYIAIVIGVLFTLAILYINDHSFTKYGFFAQDIKHTLFFDLLKKMVINIVNYSSTVRNWAYFLWFACLSGGIVLSWEFRFKTAAFITKIFKYIHEKA